MFIFLTKLMSCGTCGTDAPHGESSENQNKCLACECPCEMHKEHTHEEHHAEPEHHEGQEGGEAQNE